MTEGLLGGDPSIKQEPKVQPQQKKGYTKISNLSRMAKWRQCTKQMAQTIANTSKETDDNL
jgi:hypothetical protein